MAGRCTNNRYFTLVIKVRSWYGIIKVSNTSVLTLLTISYSSYVFFTDLFVYLKYYLYLCTTINLKKEVIMGTFWVVVICVYLLICVYAGYQGSKREIGNGLAFTLCFFFSPLLGLLFVLCSDRLDDKRLRRLQMDYYERMLK